MSALTKDIDKCSDAVNGDKTGISNIQALLKDPTNAKLREQVRHDIQEDLTGDRQALKDDPSNARRAAYVAALDQAVLDNPRYKLDDGQRKLVETDRDNKLKDYANCIGDKGHEAEYISNDAKLLQALKEPSNLENLSKAGNAVIADRNADIRREGADSSPFRRSENEGTGYIGQDERSIVSDLRLAQSFAFKGDATKRVGGDKPYLVEHAQSSGYLDIPPLKDKS